jgi:hypothetical protein
MARKASSLRTLRLCHGGVPGLSDSLWSSTLAIWEWKRAVCSSPGRSRTEEFKANAPCPDLREEARGGLRNGPSPEAPSPILWGAPCRRRVRCACSLGEEVIALFEGLWTFCGSPAHTDPQKVAGHSWIPCLTRSAMHPNG